MGNNFMFTAKLSVIIRKIYVHWSYVFHKLPSIYVEIEVKLLRVRPVMPDICLTFNGHRE